MVIIRTSAVDVSIHAVFAGVICRCPPDWVPQPMRHRTLRPIAKIAKLRAELEASDRPSRRATATPEW